MGFSFGPLFGGSPPPPPPPPRSAVYLYIFVGLFVAQNFWEAYLKLRRASGFAARMAFL